MEAATADLTAFPARAPWRGLRSDRALAERFRAGDERAFAVLYRRHSGRVRAVCLGVLGSSEDAADAEQDTWEAAAAGLAAMTPASVPAWLATVARNSAIDVLRRRRERPHPSPGDLAAVEAGPDASGAEGLDDLLAALRALPERQRTALVMREMGGWSYPEIAAALAVDEAAVNGLIARARIGLRRARRPELGCDQVQAHLAAELDGRRRPSEIRRHLRSCSECREFRSDLRDDRRALRALAPPLGLKWLLALALGRGGRTALVGGSVLAQGTARGPSKLVALCVAAVCAAGGVQEVERGVESSRDDAPAVSGGTDRGRSSPPPRRIETAPATATGSPSTVGATPAGAARTGGRERAPAGTDPRPARREDTSGVELEPDGGDRAPERGADSGRERFERRPDALGEDGGGGFATRGDRGGFDGGGSGFGRDRGGDEFGGGSLGGRTGGDDRGTFGGRSSGGFGDEGGGFGGGGGSRDGGGFAGQRSAGTPDAGGVTAGSGAP